MERVFMYKKGRAIKEKGKRRPLCVCVCVCVHVYVCVDILYLFCCCSVTQLCPTLCDPMNYSTPGIPVLH